MRDDILMIGNLDQDQIIDREQELLKRVTDEINAAADSHDIDRAVKVCDYFQKAAKLSGKSLAHALYVMEHRWNDFGIGEDFIDYIFARVGLHRHTVERYIKVAKLLHEGVPEEFRPELESKGIQTLIPIANAFSQGYEFDLDAWSKLTDASNYAEAANIINNDVKHEKPREGALGLWINREGSILAYRGEDSPKFVGSLEINDSDPAIQQAIERIIKNAGILQV